MASQGWPRATLVHVGVLVPLGLVCLVVGVVGLGRLGEDYCPRHAPPEAGSWRGPSLSGVPPTFVCTYALRGGETPTSRHRLEPSAFLGAWLLGTVGVMGGAILALDRVRRRGDGPTSPASRRRA